MSTLKGANVTKVDAGGSGDNIVSDGYIKTVEKVWLDTYTVAAAITSADSIIIARVPEGKKLTSVEITIPALGTTTSSTIALGTAAKSTTYGSVTDWNTAAERLFTLPNTGRQAVVGTQSAIHLSFSPATTLTGVTIKSIVRYT